LVSDIPAGDGNVANLFYSVLMKNKKEKATFVFAQCVHDYVKNLKNWLTISRKKQILKSRILHGREINFLPGRGGSVC
jgi:hypothetical protein